MRPAGRGLESPDLGYTLALGEVFEKSLVMPAYNIISVPPPPPLYKIILQSSFLTIFFLTEGGARGGGAEPPTANATIPPPFGAVTDAVYNGCIKWIYHIEWWDFGKKADDRYHEQSTSFGNIQG